MAGKGGKQPGAGRPKGVPNKITAEVKELAQRHGPDMIAALVQIAKESESDAARVSAIKEVLDRAYGKSKEHATVDVNVTLSGLIAKSFDIGG